MRTWDYNDIRKHGACVDRGHDFKLDSADGGVRKYTCKCGATAVSTLTTLKVDHGRPKSKEEKAAEREARKNAHLGLRQS